MGPLRHGLRRLTFDRFGAFGRRILRTDNASLPHLQNKVIYGRVESRNEDGFYTVDIGFKSPSMFHEKELRRGIGTRLKEEPLPANRRPARAVRAVPAEPDGGDGGERRRSRPRTARSEGAWREILQHYSTGTHVKGRVLNAVNGGYAVGIAGLVAFLPNQCVRPFRGSPEPPAGELLPFKILGVTESIKNVILVGPMTGGARRDARDGTAPWAGRGSNRGGHGKEKGARSNQGGKADERPAEGARDAGAFWKRKKHEARDAGASTWVKLSGAEEKSGGARGAAVREKDGRRVKKTTAPLERAAEDGRPMWGGRRESDGEGARGVMNDWNSYVHAVS
jgi:hypothetical protein